MSTARYVHWQDQGMWLGYFEEFPDYLTQGQTLPDLQDNLMHHNHCCPGREFSRGRLTEAFPCSGKAESVCGWSEARKKYAVQDDVGWVVFTAFSGTLFRFGRPCCPGWGRLAGVNSSHVRAALV